MERRLNTVEKFDSDNLTQMCARCHSGARVQLQRRPAARGLCFPAPKVPLPIHRTDRRPMQDAFSVDGLTPRSQFSNSRCSPNLYRTCTKRGFHADPHG